MRIRPQVILASACLAVLLPSVATAQVQGFYCAAGAGPPALARAEGVAELVSDVVFTCSGGSAGQNISTNVSLFVNTALTSRIFAPSTSLGEPLLLIDDLNGGASPGTNLYQGTISGNAAYFTGVQFTAPGPSATRTLRFTNLRVDASGLPQSGAEPPRIQTMVSFSGASAVPVNNPEQTVGFAVRGIDFALRGAADSALVLTIPFDQAGGLNSALALSPSATGGTVAVRLPLP